MGAFYMWNVYFNVIPYILDEFKPVNHLSTYSHDSRPLNPYPANAENIVSS